MKKQKFKNSNDDVDAGVMNEKIINIEEKVIGILNKLDNQYVMKVEFDPIKNIVYGLISTLLFGVFGALITLVIKK